MKPEWDGQDKVVEVYHTDGQGSVRALTNRLGSTDRVFRYDPFGSPANPAANPQPCGYTGQQQDVEAGLVYLRARYYDPDLGRFLQRDSVLGDLQNPLTLNRYAYAGHNPVNNSDPSGHWAVPLAGLYSPLYQDSGWGLARWINAWLGPLTATAAAVSAASQGVVPRINPWLVRFSQDSINYRCLSGVHAGETIDDLAQAMRAAGAPP